MSTGIQPSWFMARLTFMVVKMARILIQNMFTGKLVKW